MRWSLDDLVATNSVLVGNREFDTGAKKREGTCSVSVGEGAVDQRYYVRDPTKTRHCRRVDGDRAAGTRRHRQDC